MRILRDPVDVNLLPPGLMRSLLAGRFAELSQDEPYDPAINGFFILVEAGDSMAAIEQASGCRLRGNRFSEVCFGDANFVPDWECLELHAGHDGEGACFEITFVLSDDGYGVILLIPQCDDIDPELLTLCRAYAKPSTVSTVY